MAVLTTPARVRNRIKIKTADISDAVLNEYIEDMQASIEAYAERTFEVSDPLFGVARSVCTDQAACQALLFLLNIPTADIIYQIDMLKIDKSDPAANKVRLLKLIWDRANKRILLLKPPQITLLPRTSTPREH